MTPIVIFSLAAAICLAALGHETATAIVFGLAVLLHALPVVMSSTEE